MIDESKISYDLFTRQHDCLTTFGVKQQTFLQARNDHVMAARWLMGLSHKIDLWSIAKGLASA